MLDRILRTEPVRLYAVIGAAVAIGAYFIPSGAWPLVLALGAAVLGVGEGVRQQVWSADSHHLIVDQVRAVNGLPPSDDIPSTGSPDAGAVDLATINAVCLVIIAVVAVLHAFGKLPL